MFHGGPALDGKAGGDLPDELKLLWTFKTGGAIKSSAAIVAGRVYIGSNDGHVYALDAASGEKVWAFKTEGEVEATR